jgi:serine/threonine-protein kinase
MSPHDDPSGLSPVPRPGGDSAQNHSSLHGHEQLAVDPAATNCSTPPASDPYATRHGETPPDPYATNYGPTASDTEGLQPGTCLARFGDYELLEEIGRGGMAIVYKARQQTPERLVALKMIKSAELAGTDEVRRFRLEANEVARLDHPHIVPVYEVGEHGGQQLFTMKLFEGGSLNRHLARNQADLKATAQLVAMSARAVHHAHQRQLLHRDLKPGNILLDRTGQPHVADFGLAKRLGSEGEASQSVAAGTPEYMAPEQARGDPRLTTAVDVYGLGGVLYALLTGRPPFRGQSLWETLQQVQSQEPALPSAYRAGCPRDLETIGLKCLAKEPGRRYGSAEALADDLERWLRGEPVLARPAGRWERVRM